MGFYLRKSVSVGPFRFNLSKSGIGVSAGIKGLRVGSGPRGNYVHMGRGGIYFRQTLPNPKPIIHERSKQRPSDVHFEDIESGDVSQMVDSSSAALLAEINSKSSKLVIWPGITILGFVILLLLAFFNAPVAGYWLFMPFWAAGIICSLYADKLRKTVVLFYRLEPHVEKEYQNLHNAFRQLYSASRKWHIESSGKIVTTYDWKVNAGASALVRRNVINPDVRSPSYFKCNLSVPFLPAGRQRLYFLPDRVLVWDTNGVGAVGFEQLEINFREQRFIEEQGVPRDSRVVDTTWKYVNKKGGPDRRFNNNRQIPVVLYEEILLTSRTGLQELFQVSKTGLGSQISAAIKQMAAAIAQCNESPRTAAFIKCPCNNCNMHIEFPTYGVGQKVSCPHCGMETVLFEPRINL